MTEIKYITKIENVIKHRDEILQAQRLGVDCETANKNGVKDTALDPFVGELRLLQLSTSPEKVFVFDVRHLRAESNELDFIRDIIADKKKVKIFHNGKFDAKFLKKQFFCKDISTVFDTMLGSNISACGDDQIRHNLASAVARFTKKNIDKSEQMSDFAQNVLSDKQIRYGATDALILHELADSITKQLELADLLRAAYVEFNAVEAFCDLELNGFFLNFNDWLKIVEKNKKIQEEKAALLHAEFSKVSSQGSLFGGSSDFKLDSSDDVTRALRLLGVPIEDSTLAWKIEPLIPKFPIIQTLLDYRQPTTALKTFGENWAAYIHNATGRIHSDFRQLGTPTGRTTCSNPNLQQIPGGAEYRKCFQAQSEDKSLIVADYSQIELRLMADFSADEKLVNAFNSNQDLHSLTASQVFNKPIEMCGKGTEFRSFGKRLNFSVCYGLGASRYSMRAGVSVDEARRQLKAFWNTYSRLDSYLTEKARQAVNERESRSFSGRTWRYNFDSEDSNSVSGVERNGKNYSIQASASDIFKRALFLLTNALKETSGKIVNIVHDEIVVEADKSEAEKVARIVEREMVRAGREVITKIPCKVDAQISHEWEK